MGVARCLARCRGAWRRQALCCRQMRMSAEGSRRGALVRWREGPGLSAASCVHARVRPLASRSTGRRPPPPSSMSCAPSSCQAVRPRGASAWQSLGLKRVWPARRRAVAGPWRMVAGARRSVRMTCVPTSYCDWPMARRDGARPSVAAVASMTARSFVSSPRCSACGRNAPHRACLVAGSEAALEAASKLTANREAVAEDILHARLGGAASRAVRGRARATGTTRPQRPSLSRSPPSPRLAGRCPSRSVIPGQRRGCRPSVTCAALAFLRVNGCAPTLHLPCPCTRRCLALALTLAMAFPRCVSPHL